MSIDAAVVGALIWSIITGFAFHSIGRQTERKYLRDAIKCGADPLVLLGMDPTPQGDKP